MWSKYNCSNCRAEILYPSTMPSGGLKCTTFHGNPSKDEGYCLGTLKYMEDVSINEVSRQHRRQYEHGKINATAN